MRRLRALKAVPLLGLLAVGANGAIPILNSSFEMPTQANGGYQTAPPLGWTVANGGNAIAVWNPGISPYPNFYYDMGCRPRMANK